MLFVINFYYSSIIRVPPEKRSDKKKSESNPQAVTIAFQLPKNLPTQFLCCGVVF